MICNGKYVIRHNAIYVGEMLNGKANGYGAIFYKNGDVCYAEFINGNIMGKYRMYYKNPHNVVFGNTKKN